MIKIALLVAIGIYFAIGHPTVSFQVTLTDSEGNVPPANVSTSGTQRIYFTFQDMLSNYTTIEFKDLLLHHARYIHLLVMSFDWLKAAHVHPDDYKVMTVNNTQSVFFVDMSFPIPGWYSLSFDFMYNDRARYTYREGVSLIDMYVSGPPPYQTPNTTTFNYTTQNSFRTYPINSSEIFDQWVDVRTNTDTSVEGFTAILTIDGQATPMSNGLPPNLGTNIKVLTDACSTMYIDVFDSAGSPAKIIPYLAASAHFTISNRDNAVYHAHGMYRTNGLNMEDVVTSLNGMTMQSMHQLDEFTNPLYNLSMNAMMIGVQTNGSVNCFSDAGTVMKQMDGMMNMSAFYGPATFSSLMGIFNFPDIGHFTIYVYMKLLMHDGSERLFVPSFAVSAYLPDQSSTTMVYDGDMDGDQNNGNSSFGNLSFGLLLLFITCTFF